jgi:hypothetical protein
VVRAQGHAAIRQEPQVDPLLGAAARVRTAALARNAWRRTVQAQFAYPLRKRLAAALGRNPLPLLLAASDLDPQRDGMWRAAADFPQASMRCCPTPKPSGRARRRPSSTAAH